jgi:hypothetical protein
MARWLAGEGTISMQRGSDLVNKLSGCEYKAVPVNKRGKGRVSAKKMEDRQRFIQEKNGRQTDAHPGKTRKTARRSSQKNT